MAMVRSQLVVFPHGWECTLQRMASSWATTFAEVCAFRERQHRSRTLSWDFSFFFKKRKTNSHDCSLIFAGDRIPLAKPSRAGYLVRIAHPRQQSREAKGCCSVSPGLAVWAIWAQQPPLEDTQRQHLDLKQHQSRGHELGCVAYGLGGLILVVLLSSCVVLGKSLNFSDHQFTHL